MNEAGRGNPGHGNPGDGDDAWGAAGTSAAAARGPERSSRALIAFVAVALAILVVGIIVWVASGGAEDDVPSASVAASVTDGNSATVPTTVPATVPTTVPATTPPTTVPATTAPSTVPPTTEAPGFSLPEPGADTWTVASDFEPVAPEMTLALAATDGEIRAFDGVVDGLRCVGVVGPGDAVTTWCGSENIATTFLADRGLEPVVVGLGAETGSVTIAPQASGWTLGSNGCSAPMATILGGVDPGALAVTGVVCRGNEAFMAVGSSFFGPGIAPDGGGILAAAGAEGWNLLDFGTAVESELSEAVLPLPPVDVLGGSSVDIVGVTDRTAEVEGWIGDTTDPAAIEAAAVDQLVDPESEAPAVTRRAEGLQSGRYQLLIVEIPQLDDSFAAETWAIWIGSADETRGVTAFSWATCRRGVTGDGLCV